MQIEFPLPEKVMPFSDDAHYAQSLEAMLEPATQAFDNAFCVQAWLGFGQVLFLGFGDRVLTPTEEDAKHPLPSVELQTKYAGWCVEDAAGVASGGTRQAAENAANRLVGQKVIGWSYNGHFDLRLDFENGDALFVTPWPDLELRGQDAWYVRNQDGTYATAICVGDGINELDRRLHGK